MQKTPHTLGIDVGSVSVKLAVILHREIANQVLTRAAAPGFWRTLTPANQPDAVVLVAPYRRTRGQAARAVRELLAEALAALPGVDLQAAALTGSASKTLTAQLGASKFNGFQALARAVDWMCPDVRSVFEIGGETSKFLRLAPDATGRLGIVDYGTNGDCAAGTGSFLDQQAGRLQYAVEDLGDIVATAERAAQIAGRCSVFAKSDMIHAQQKGFTPPEVLRGLCNAVAANYRSAVVKGRTVGTPAALVGGVSANRAVVQALLEAFELDRSDLCVPPAADAYGAIGAAALAWEGAAVGGATIALRQRLDGNGNGNGNTKGNGHALNTSPRLNMDRVRVLRDAIRPYALSPDGAIIDAYLGLDIGSVGTKVVAIDQAGDIIHTIFTRTDGRPIAVVTRCLREVEEAVGARIRVRGVGTTGSGRELIGELVGADSVNDEITAHKTGASYVGDRLLGKRPDTIFEIGGQDSKYISLQHDAASGDTVVVDFTMNEACAAGTGSFLEERAEELGVAIKDEFARRALAATAPVKLGERCTVFMERDVNACMQRGADRDNVIAGLAYSVAYNYINRVVRGRPIGDCVFFQGGTAYNDAVAAAFSMICGKEIIVPPHNAVLGALGAALLAREKVTESGRTTRFRGYNLAEVDYQLKEFTCHGCGNQCSVQQFTVDGEKTYWGDKCSERFRKRAKSEKKPVIPDLIALRHELLAADDSEDPTTPLCTVGIPLAMYTLGLLPLWRRFFRDCGCRVIVSSETNRETVRAGLEAAVAEPCFPIIVAHGHAAELVERDVDCIWLPNIVTALSPATDNEAYVCPWGQTLPFVLRQAPTFRGWGGRILCPTLRMGDGLASIRSALTAVAVDLGTPRAQAQDAFDAAVAAQERFERDYIAAGQAALAQLAAKGDDGIVIVGRPYNIHDGGVSLSTARKLRDLYGVNVIPIDALPLDGIDVCDVNDNMFWEYGRRILAAGKFVRDNPNLHIIYITNFKCGPDSFVKSFLRDAAGKPFLTLQFDGHSNDAGMMTRCEAYLDSKGILRWWRKPEQASAGRRTENDSPQLEEDCTSPRCPAPALD